MIYSGKYFYEKIVYQYIGMPIFESDGSLRIIKEPHKRVPNDYNIRKTCENCKEKKINYNGHEYKKTNQICNICNKYLCKSCFIELHK